MPSIQFPVQIRHIKRLTSSSNGNPRYELVLDDMLSWCGIFPTSSDYTINYEIGNPGYRVGDWVTAEFTRARRITLLHKAEAPDYAQLRQARNA